MNRRILQSTLFASFALYAATVRAQDSAPNPPTQPAVSEAGASASPSSEPAFIAINESSPPQEPSFLTGITPITPQPPSSTLTPRERRRARPPRALRAGPPLFTIGYVPALLLGSVGLVTCVGTGAAGPCSLATAMVPVVGPVLAAGLFASTLGPSPTLGAGEAATYMLILGVLDTAVQTLGTLFWARGIVVSRRFQATHAPVVSAWSVLPMAPGSTMGLSIVGTIL